MQAARQVRARAQLGRIPRGGARLPFAAAEHRLRRHRRQHRLHRAGPRAAAQARQRPEGPWRPRRAGWRNTTGTASSRSRSCRAATIRPSGDDRHRQPPHHAAGLSVLHHQRMGAALPRRAHPAAARRDAQAHACRASRASRPTSVSLAVRELLPRLLATRPRSERGAQGARAAARNGTARWPPARAEPLIVWAWWRELDARDLRRRAGRRVPAATGSRAPTSSPTCSRATPAAGALVRRRAHAGKRDLRRAACRSRSMPALADLQRALRRRPHALALGRGALRAPRAPPLRPPAAAREALRHHACPRPAIPTPSTSAATTLDDEAAPFANRHAASLRAIYDLSDLDKSLYIHSTGQSGNILSPHYEAFTAGLGEERVHPDARRAQDPRGRAASDAAAGASQVEVVRDQRADHERRAAELDRRRSCGPARPRWRTR